MGDNIEYRLSTHIHLGNIEDNGFGISKISWRACSKYCFAICRPIVKHPWAWDPQPSLLEGKLPLLIRRLPLLGSFHHLQPFLLQLHEVHPPCMPSSQFIHLGIFPAFCLAAHSFVSSISLISSLDAPSKTPPLFFLPFAFFGHSS